jgi:thiosulfate/3-mercaptopyruvate sulfurtransferase
MPALDLPSDLVSTDWLAAHLGDPGLVVVDASVLGTETPVGFRWLSGLDEYLIDGHIPGAVFGDLLEEFSDPEGPYSFTRPEPARVERAARDLGIDDDVAVVVYDSSIAQWAARLWWILASAGLSRVAVLDGGLARWRAEGRAIETGFEAPRRAGALSLSPRERFWADGIEVQRIVAGEADAALVCALPPSDFRGETGRRARRGHIPGSVNVPVGSVVDRETRTLLQGAELEARLAAATAGHHPSRVVVYCGAGIAAAGTGFALRLAGHPDVAIYDGSLDEWVADPAAPLVTLA